MKMALYNTIKMFHDALKIFHNLSQPFYQLIDVRSVVLKY